MAIIYTYPETQSLTGDDLLVVSKSDGSLVTNSVTLRTLAQFMGSGGATGGPYLPLTAGSTVPLTGDLYLAPTGAGPSVGSRNLVFRGVDDLGGELDASRIFTLDSVINPKGQDLFFQTADDNGVLRTGLFIDAFQQVAVNKNVAAYQFDVGGSFNADGNIFFSTYGTGAKTGVATYNLAVTAAGYVVEQPLSIILINGLINNLASAGSGGYDFMEWVSNVTSTTQIPVMKTPRNITLKSMSYSWMGDTPLVIGAGEQIEFTMGTIPSGVNPIIANYTASAFLFDLTSADNGTYANDVITGFSIPFSAGDVIAVVGQETGSITPNTGELSLSFEFEIS